MTDDDPTESVAAFGLVLIAACVWLAFFVGGCGVAHAQGEPDPPSRVEYKASLDHCVSQRCWCPGCPLPLRSALGSCAVCPTSEHAQAGVIQEIPPPPPPSDCDWSWLGLIAVGSAVFGGLVALARQPTSHAQAERNVSVLLVVYYVIMVVLVLFFGFGVSR